MRVPKKYLIYSLFLIFFSFFFVNNSYAVDDIELQWYGTTRPNFQYLCGQNTGLDCTDYNYMIIYQDFDSNFSFDSSLHSYIGFGINNYNSLYIPIYAFSSPVIIPLSDNLTSLYYNASSEISAYTSLGVSIRLVLSEFNPFESVPSPSGSIEITSNGTYDVTSYVEAVVDVPATVIQGDYHDDLVRIYKAIMTCGAVVLVLYFFYCIYRMIIKSTGGKQ